MLPVFTVVMARDAVARQFDYDDAAPVTADVAPAALPRRRTSLMHVLRDRLSTSFVRTTWSPTR
jgi:hypothetical protein